MVNQRLPMGIENFEELRTGNYYYVDKTGLIVDLLNNWGEVNLFNRPSCFGKTVNLSMLKSFFQIGCDKSLFDGLEISKHKDLCDAYMGQYPVVAISLSSVFGSTYEGAFEQLRWIIGDVANRLDVLRDSKELSEYDQRDYQRLVQRNAEYAHIVSSLYTLTYLLEKHYHKKVILLIDDYDMPLTEAAANGYYDQMVSLISGMFGWALKTNSSLKFGVVMGCLQVCKNGDTSGLNNISVYESTKLRYDKHFGFTEDEVRQMLTDYGLDHHLDEMRKWYGGYLIGSQNMYCPSHVIAYCRDLSHNPQAEPRICRLDSTYQDELRLLFENANTGTIRMEIENLLNGKTISKALNVYLTHNEAGNDIDNIWSLLYLTGYLTVTKKPSQRWYTLRIPNENVRKLYKRHVLLWFQNKMSQQKDQLTDLYNAFENGNTEVIAKQLTNIMIDAIRYYDAQKPFSHDFLMIVLRTCSKWGVSENLNFGYPCTNVIAEREDGTAGFAIEAREVREWEQLDEACDAAMKQIEEKDYTAVLRRYSVEKIWTYGIAFWEIECRVVAKKVEQDSLG